MAGRIQRRSSARLFGGAIVLTGLVAGPALFSSPTIIVYFLLADPQEVLDNAIATRWGSWRPPCCSPSRSSR